MSAEEWETIENGQTRQNVIESFGEPSRSLTEDRDMLDVVNEQINLNEERVYNDPTLRTLESQNVMTLHLDTLDNIHSLITTDSDVRIDIYEVSVTPDSEQGYVTNPKIYYYRDKVIYRDSFM